MYLRSNWDETCLVVASIKSDGLTGSLWLLGSLWASLVAQMIKHLPAMWETWVQSLGWEDRLEKRKATHSCITELPFWLSWYCNVGDLGSISGLGQSPGEGKGHPVQYSGLENSMDCIVHGVTRVGHDWVTFTILFNKYLNSTQALFSKSYKY